MTTYSGVRIPKTQSALLEAMEEGQVSVDGVSRKVPAPFLVAATQNPVEYEGTYPLPEAQLDRFLLKVVLPIPERDQELEILRRHAAGFDPRDVAAAGVTAVAGPADIAAGQAAVGTVQVTARGGRATSSTSPEPPGSRRRSASASARVVPPRCCGRPAPGPGSPAATSSRPTTSRRSRTPPSSTGSGCARRPSSRASTWPRCSLRRSTRCRSPASSTWSSLVGSPCCSSSGWCRSCSAPRPARCGSGCWWSPSSSSPTCCWRRR